MDNVDVLLLQIGTLKTRYEISFWEAYDTKNLRKKNN